MHTLLNRSFFRCNFRVYFNSILCSWPLGLCWLKYRPAVSFYFYNIFLYFEMIITWFLPPIPFPKHLLISPSNSYMSVYSKFINAACSIPIMILVLDDFMAFDLIRDNQLEALPCRSPCLPLWAFLSCTYSLSRAESLGDVALPC